MLLFDQEFYNKNGYARLGKTLTREQLKLMKQECMKKSSFGKGRENDGKEAFRS